MNNKGQTLVLFVVLVPFILMLFAFVVDFAYISMKNSELETLASSSLKYIVKDKKPKEKVIKIIKENDKNIEIIEITNNTIHLKNEINSIFGRIIGLKNYNIEKKISGKLINNKLVTSEKGK